MNDTSDSTGAYLTAVSTQESAPTGISFLRNKIGLTRMDVVSRMMSTTVATRTSVTGSAVLWHQGLTELVAQVSPKFVQGEQA